METPTAASHAPSTMMLGVNPKHPDYSSTDHHLHDPIHVMKQAKQAMEEWMTIVVPNVIPRVKALRQQVAEFKNEHDPHPTATTKENNENSDNHSTKKVDDTLHTIFDQTMACERQIQTTYDRLHTIKGQIRDAMTVPSPQIQEALHYLSPIAQLPVFGGRPVHTASQDLLHDYYQHDFLARYETATVEYDQVMDECQHVMLQVSNLRSSHPTAGGRRTH